MCKCGDAWPRPRAPAGPPRLSSMLRRRLCWRLRPPLPPHGPGDRDARRKVPPPPCTGLCDCPGPPPSLPRQKLLHCAPVIYIFQGWVLPNATRSPRRGEGAGELGGRGRAGAGRSVASPRPYPRRGRVQLCPRESGEHSALPQGPKSPQSLGGAGPPSRGGVNVSMTKPGGGNTNKITLVLPPILSYGKTSGEKHVRWLWRTGAL